MLLDLGGRVTSGGCTAFLPLCPVPGVITLHSFIALGSLGGKAELRSSNRYVPPSLLISPLHYIIYLCRYITVISSAQCMLPPHVLPHTHTHKRSHSQPAVQPVVLVAIVCQQLLILIDTIAQRHARWNRVWMQCETIFSWRHTAHCTRKRKRRRQEETNQTGPHSRLPIRDCPSATLLPFSVLARISETSHAKFKDTVKHPVPIPNLLFPSTRSTTVWTGLVHACRQLSATIFFPHQAHLTARSKNIRHQSARTEDWVRLIVLLSAASSLHFLAFPSAI